MSDDAGRAELDEFRAELREERAQRRLLLEKTEQMANRLRGDEHRFHERWSLVEIVAAVLGIVLGAGALGAPFLIRDVARQMAEVEAKSQEVANVIETSTVLTEALAKLSTAQWKFARDHYEMAADASDEAIKLVRDLDADPGSPLARAKDAVMGEGLRMQARAYFQVRDYPSMAGPARALTQGYPDDWEGWHFLGLFRWMVQENEEKAEAAFQRSVHLYEEKNPDYLNLSELALRRGDFASAWKHAREFSHPGEAVDTQKHPHQVMATFFAIVAGYGAGKKTEQDVARFSGEIGSGQYPNLLRFFDPQFLDEIPKQIGGAGKDQTVVENLIQQVKCATPGGCAQRVASPANAVHQGG